MSRSAFAAMRFDVSKHLAYPGRRFPVSLVLSGEPDAVDGLSTVESIALDGEAFAQLSTLYLDLAIRATITQPCRRCLRPVRVVREIEESLDVAIPPGAGSVDLYPDIVRLVLSAHDPNVLCRSDCRGLCPVCGADRNEDPTHSCEEDEGRGPTLRELLMKGTR